MKKVLPLLLISVLCLSLPRLAAEPVTYAPVSDAAKQLKTYEVLLPALIQQRDQATQRALNLELQLVALKAELAAALKELEALRQSLSPSVPHPSP